MKYTPGPWEASDSVGWAIYPEKPGASHIAQLNKWRSNSAANARLMAAAPDMLEALELVQQYWATNPGLTYEITTMEVVEKAIAKAKGE